MMHNQAAMSDFFLSNASHIFLVYSFSLCIQRILVLSETLLIYKDSVLLQSFRIYSIYGKIKKVKHDRCSSKFLINQNLSVVRKE